MYVCVCMFKICELKVANLSNSRNNNQSKLRE